MTRDQRELAWRRHQRHEFHPPSPDLAAHVARYWVVEWTYDRPYRQLVVPYPNVHLTFGDRGAVVSGVSSGHVVKELDGTGRVFGVAFRPGAFRPFLGAPVQSLTDRAVPAATIFDHLPAHADLATVEDALRRHLPEPDPRARQAVEVVDRIADDPLMTRVDVLAREVGGSVRQLQRLFAEHVGVGPKWVIRRYRLREVTERMAAGGAIDWAELAADLGYADQPHFVRDFTAMVGETPTKYADRYRDTAATGRR
ncbi:helix-turn-helix domain-containing protein [Saccharothrix sp. S26]|uniref:helix-turn-helix domain-containing protein n=1 Tax=Saccharothrix sp. S26 TaxID=2907215 RepID=UPI001F480260|nr:helix-turn-helix domain-containing protein [Saccharothrix sp. S26]MCE7000145.1 helix-turn-helix domain-containing protein [Saccharothrix sp. S26]